MTQRADQPPFVHLHLHTQYSLLDGAIQIPEPALFALGSADPPSLIGAVAFLGLMISPQLKMRI